MNTFNAIVFDTESDCVALQQSILGRVTHSPAWLPFIPIALSDGRWAAEIADTIRGDLTAEELAQVEEIPRDLIPNPPRF